MKTVAISHARAHLSSLLRDVERGEPVVITRRGRPIAELVPTRARPRSGDEYVQVFRALREGVRLGGLEIRDLIDEGRRL